MSAMSSSAKEQLFRKDRNFTEPQLLWLHDFAMLSSGVSRERLIVNAFRGALLHLKCSRSILMEWSNKLAHTQPSLKRNEITVQFQGLIHRAPQTFRGDDILKRKLRELAQMCGLQPTEILRATQGRISEMKE